MPRQPRHGVRILCLIALGLGLAACNRNHDAEKPVAAASLRLAGEDVVQLGSETLANGPVVTGSIQAARRADLRAEVSAVVIQVLKENGDAVKRGDLLVRLDDTAIRDNLASADEAVRAAQQTLTQAERQLQRLQTLRVSGMASMQQLDDTETRRNNATSELAAARSRQAQAKQQSLRTEVRAPFDGIVSERKASVGDTAQLGKELLKVIDPASLRFEGFVAADQIGQLRVGQEVRFRANGQGDREFLGSITRISPAANPNTRQIEVMVAINSTTRLAIAGLYAEGRIVTGARALTIPSTALMRDGDKAYAWRIDGQQLRQTVLSVGERDSRRGSYVVNHGLKEGDQVLRHPNLSLRDGQAVELSTPASH